MAPSHLLWILDPLALVAQPPSLLLPPPPLPLVLGDMFSLPLLHPVFISTPTVIVLVVALKPWSSEGSTILKHKSDGDRMSDGDSGDITSAHAVLLVYIGI